MPWCTYMPSFFRPDAMADAAHLQEEVITSMAQTARVHPSSPVAARRAPHRPPLLESVRSYGGAGGGAAGAGPA
jgi:hypothetical protein